MEKPITASFRWTKEEMLRATRHAMRHTAGMRHMYIVLRVAAVLMLLSGTYSFATNHMDLTGFMGMLVLSIVFLGMPLLPRLGVLRNFRQAPNRDKLVEYEITGESIRSKTDLGVAERKWAGFIKVVRVRDGFLLAVNAGIFEWLPNHGFTDPLDIECFAELAKSKVQRYEEAGRR